MMAHKKIFIITGEPSGDLHASNLVKELKKLYPDIKFSGICGELSRKEGVETVFDITKLALVGALEVLKHLPTINEAHKIALSSIKNEKPDLVILVDYPGFNLKIAPEISKMGIPIAYYISPQIWAWGRQRVYKIKKYIKKMLVFFGFEKELYKSYGIDAEFIGHPLLDTVKVSRPKEATIKKYGLSETEKIIAILPGSRISEIKKLLPIIAKGCETISKKDPSIQFVISKHPDRPVELYEKALSGASFNYKTIEGDVHNIIAAADFCVSVSGTVTLETAIIGTPYIIVYKANLITYLLYLLVADIRFLGLANIIAGREIVQELLQYKMTARNIAGITLKIISDEKKLSDMRAELKKVAASLGEPGANLRAATAIMKLL